jgi:YidC/Oxa1 family membrane protein insertase
MDKRTVIAVLLTFVVLVAWQMLYVSPKQKELELQREAATELERARLDSLSMAGEETGQTGAADQGPAERDERRPETEAEPETPLTSITRSTGAPPVRITVRTETMHLVLNSLAGDIREVELVAYERMNDGNVQLVPEEGAGGFAISLYDGVSWRRLTEAGYSAVVNGRLVTEDEEIVLSDASPEAAVAFVLEDPAGGRIEKRFTFVNEGYEVRLDIEIEREGWMRGMSAYALVWDCGLAVNEKNAGGDVRQFAALGMVGEEYYQEAARKFSKDQEKLHEGMVTWAGARTKYFLSAVMPEQQRSGTLALIGDKERDLVGYEIRYPFRGDPRFVHDAYRCYIGPLDMNELKNYGVGLERTIDLGRLRFLSVLVLRFMLFLKRFIPNYGVIIIILSVLTKVLFYRLTHKSTKSMKDMQRLQPKIKELQEKFKDDKERLNKETMKLYKEAGVNPLGGCLPLLLQMPVFFALFNVLRNTIELRGAPFALWIKDLSSPDVLFEFGFSIPFIGNEFHLLPILMGGAMVLQTKMGASPTGEAAPAAQTKMMSTMMPIMFTFFFYGMPSGLVLYWIVNNILTIVQQYYVHKEVDKEEREKAEKEAAETKKSRRGSNKKNGPKVVIDRSEDIEH